MTTKEKIQSWKWRIIRAGYNGKSFAELVDVPAPQLSDYCNEKKSPSIERFDLIEGKLKQLENSQCETSQK